MVESMQDDGWDGDGWMNAAIWDKTESVRESWSKGKGCYM